MKVIYVALLLATFCGCSKNSATTELGKSASSLASSDVGSKWRKVWTSPSIFDELKKFQKENGLYLETVSKISGDSYLAEEGPCGETYVSLVKDARQLPERIHEIDPKGKRVASWNSGSGQVLRFEGDRLIRKVEFFENPEDYSLTSTKNSKSKSHAFELAIDSSGALDLLSPNTQGPKSPFREVKCPPLPKEAKSDYSYCVEDPGSKRKFVFQKPCT